MVTTPAFSSSVAAVALVWADEPWEDEPPCDEPPCCVDPPNGEVEPSDPLPGCVSWGSSSRAWRSLAAWAAATPAVRPAA